LKLLDDKKNYQKSLCIIFLQNELRRGLPQTDIKRPFDHENVTFILHLKYYFPKSLTSA